MRAGSWLLLLVSFCLGLVSAFVVAYYTFDAKPIQVVDRGPTVKILIAHKEIAAGAEIAAEDIVFVDVPITEIPSQAATNFMQVYRRRPAFPIPVGCPICEDLLLPVQEDKSEAVKYLPAGSQLVALEVEQMRLGDTVSNIAMPISELLSVGDKIDIRVVPREEAKGEFIARKNQVLRTFAADQEGTSESFGKLVLEKVDIYDMKSSQAKSGGKQLQTLSLLLENSQVEKLHEAAREGRLRILPHRSSQPGTEASPGADQQAATAPLEETFLQAEFHTGGIRRHFEPEKTEKKVRLLDSTTTAGAQVEPRRASSGGIRTVVSVENKETRPFDSPRPRNGAHVSFVTPQTRSAAQAEPAPVVAPAATRPVTPFRPRSGNVVEVGLSYTSTEFGSGAATPEGYSPFNTQTRQTGTADATEDAENPPPPLPLRTRAAGSVQWR